MASAGVKPDANGQDGRAPRLVFLLIFLSGTCALVYQVAWTRQLGLAFGHTLHAVTAVVCAFMAGLGLGAGIGGRLADRHPSPGVLYGRLEVAIGGVAILALWLPATVTWILGWAHASLGDVPSVFAAVRVVTAIVALLLPCGLMGATYPAAVAWLARRRPDGGGSRAGAARLYAVNTLGATVGCLVAGFVLPEQIGLRNMQLAAAVLNVLVGLSAIAGGRMALRDQPATPAPPLSSRPHHATAALAPPSAVHWIVLMCGFVALLNEIVWTRAMIFASGTTTYAFSSLLTVYLVSVGVGSLLAAAGPGHAPALNARLQRALVAGSLATAFSLYVAAAALPYLDRWWPPAASWTSLLTGHLAKAAVTVAVPTALLSMVLPLAIRLARTDAALAGQAGRLYAISTAGSILGAAVAGFVAIPWLGVQRTLLAGAALAAVAALAVGREHPPGHRRQQWLAPAAVAIVVALMAGTWWSTRLAAPLHRLEGREDLLYYTEGSASTVSVVREVAGTKTIYIDGVPVAGTDPVMLTDQKSLAHIPMLLKPDARDVLTVGFGSGGASWSFSTWRTLASIDCVEIDRAVVDAAPWLTESNHEVWKDPRFRLVLDDARSFLSYTDKRYDIISTDCTDLRYKSNASLYTTDYFGLCRRRLKPGGLVVVWMPLGGVSDEMLRMAMRTFRAVFPHATLWYLHNVPTHYALLVGSLKPVRLDAGTLLDALAEDPIRRDLAEIHLDAPEKIVNGRLLDEAAYARFAGEGPLNSDDRPLLEFRAPRQAYHFAVSRNLQALASRRVPAESGVGWRRAPGEVALQGRLAASGPAVDAILAGHAAYQRQTFEFAETLREYRRAAAIDPADGTIQRLIDQTVRTRDVWVGELEWRTRQASPSAADLAALGALYAEDGRDAEAVSLFGRALTINPDLHAARRQLAAATARTGAPDRAMALYRDAIDRDPSSAEAHNDLGLLLLAGGDPVAAQNQFETAARLDVSSAAAWHNLGLARVGRGDADGARQAYERALAVDPRMVEALGNLAALHLALNRPELARPLIRKLKAVDPASAEAGLLDARLRASSP